MNKYIINIKNLLLFVLLSLAANVLLAGYFWLYSYATEAAVSGDITKVPRIAFIAAAITAGLFIIFCIIDDVKWSITITSTKKLREDILNKVYHLGYTKHNEKDASYYSSILLNDIDMIENDYFAKIVGIIGEAVQLSVMLIAIGIVEWRFLFVVFLFTTPSFIQPIILRSKLGSVGAFVIQIAEKYTRSVHEFIRAMETIKVFKSEAVFNKKYTKVTNELLNGMKKQNILHASNYAITLFAMYFFKIGIAFVFVGGALSDFIPFIAVATLFGYANQVSNPLREILNMISSIHGTIEVRKKLHQLLASDSVLSAEVQTPDISFKHEIRFDDVSFTYPGVSEPTLDHLSFSLKKGNKYLLVGQNGSGKSTLIQLLCGFLRDYKGKIFLDDVDYYEMDSEMIISKIAIVPSKSFVFCATIRDNVSLFKIGFTDEQITSAMNRAGLGKYLETLPEGLNTLIGEEGGTMSGGEKQRICLARAFLADKDIIILDEGLAELDIALSEEIERILLSSSKTILIVSHRSNNSTEEYDNIIILNHKTISFR